MAGIYPDLSHLNEGPPYPRAVNDDVTNFLRSQRCVRCNGSYDSHPPCGGRRGSSSGSDEEEAHGPRRKTCACRGSHDGEEYHGPWTSEGKPFCPCRASQDADGEEYHGPWTSEGKRLCPCRGSHDADGEEYHDPWTSEGKPFCPCRGSHDADGEEYHGPWTSDGKRACRGSHDGEEYHGPFEGNKHWCSQCGRNRPCNDGPCEGAHSSNYCGHFDGQDGCHGNDDGYDAGRCRHELLDGGYGRGRNYVMEGERLEDVVYDIEKGPHWWSHHTHHVIPDHHRGSYSWTQCQNGQVFDNAVKVGKDLDGGDVYLGRAWHEGDLLPAKITPRHGGAFVPWGCKEHTKYEYEVLLSHGHRVAWQECSRGNVPESALVVGHTHNGEALYAGRVLHSGVMVPGKIQHSHGVLYIPWDGKELNYDQYEVLIVTD